MATVSSEHMREHPELAPTTTSRTARWGYFFYCEVLKIFRDPPSVIFGICFAPILFLILGFSLPAIVPRVSILATTAAYGAFILSFQIFSLSLATERSLGWNRLLRTTSMSSALYLGSKLLVILLAGTVSMLLLFAVAGFSGKVHLDLVVWAQLLGIMVLGMLPLSLLGLFLGFLGSVNLTEALSWIVLLVVAFASGVFVPLQFLPAFVQQIAPYLPISHLIQLVYNAVGYTGGDGQVWTHVLILLAYTAGFAVLAGWAYMRDKNKNFA